MTEQQLPLFADLSGARAVSAVSEAAPPEAPVAAPGSAVDDRQLDLFADRALAHDSLLAGRLLESLDFHDDPAVADLLAEDRDPRCLACLGRIRRLWPATPPRGAERESSSAPSGSRKRKFRLTSIRSGDPPELRCPR